MLRNFKLALFLGFKSITKGNKAILALMIFIMSLAFVNLVFISSILSGIIVTLNNQIKINIVSNIVINPQEEPVKKDYIIHAEELRREIESIPGVAATAGRYKLSATIAYDKNKNGKFIYRPMEVIGVDPESEKNISEIPHKIIEGRYLEGLGTGDIVIGSDLAGGYGGAGEEIVSLRGARVGDKLKMTFSNGVVRNYTIRGIFKVNFDMVDGSMTFITTKEAESILSVYNNASQILVKIDKPEAEDYCIGQIQKIAPNLKVKKWNDYLGGLGGISESFNMITLIISAIGLAVAAITIFILIYVNVVNKRRQIGILKAIGINQNIIIYSYIFQALFYAIFGIIIGILLVFYVIGPYFAIRPLMLPMGAVRPALNSQMIIQNILSLLLAAFVAGLIPSWRAAKENILKAIWGA
ncbi:FtsX-like permease family protein [Patescibacteria group bacterium]|nr:FtsX-like permease family protein [Patescibacteria group bacterium]